MKRRLFASLIVAGMAAATGVASANTDYWRDNGLLLEVSADPRDGQDHVRVDATRANQLELIAVNNTVTLRGMTLHFADGRTMSRPLSFVRPGQPVLIELPHNCAAITSVDLDYGDPELRRRDRTSARLQIVPRMTRDYDRHDDGRRDHDRERIGHYSQPTYVEPTYSHPTYTQPTYNRPRPSSSYYYRQPMRQARQSRYTVVRPRPAQSSWEIQGSFRF